MTVDYFCELCKEPQFADEILLTNIPQTGIANLCVDCFNRLGIDGWLSVQMGIAGHVKHNAWLV